MKNLMSSRAFGELLRSDAPGFKIRLDYLKWYETLRNNYDDFLKLKLELWMFVPCKLVDGVWVVLEEPLHIFSDHPEKEKSVMYQSQLLTIEYQQAKDRVIFKNFRVNYFDLGGSPIDKNSSFQIVNQDIQICTYKSKPNYFIWNHRNDKPHLTIEDLVKYSLELTATTKNQLGL